MIRDLRKINRRSESVIRGSRRIRRYEADEKEEGAIDTMEMEAIVDMGVKALAPYDIAEMEYEEGEEPAENEAVCEAGDDAEVPVKVDGDKLVIVVAAGIGNNEEDATVEVDLTKPEADVKEELKADLEEIFGAEAKEEECKRRSEARRIEARRIEARRSLEARERRSEARRIEARRIEARRIEARRSLEARERRSEARERRLESRERRIEALKRRVEEERKAKVESKGPRRRGLHRI